MNIIVIGGTSGMGKEVVLNLAQDINNQILVTGRNKSALNALSAKFNNIYPLSLDLSTIDTQVELIRETLHRHFESVDILINMAGKLVKKEFSDITDAESRSIMEINFFGPVSVIRIIRPFMTRGSHIINISSMGGFQGSIKYKGLSVYSASKAAIACLSECLAEEFKEEGISVNCLAPGAVQTEMFAEAFPGYKAPVDAKEMGEFICGFALTGHKVMNGKVIPLALSNP